MTDHPIRTFWGNYNELIDDIERERRDQIGSSGGQKYISEIISVDSSKRPVAQSLYDLAKELITALDNDDHRSAEATSREIIHGCLDYLDRWGDHVPITADEKNKEEVHESGLSPLERLRTLAQDKGEDYESEEITYLSYCILGYWSIAHEIHKKAQRLYSVTKDKNPNFEEAADTVSDLCNYTFYFLAYMELPECLGREWVFIDELN